MSNKKVILTGFGGPEVVRVVEEPTLPEPGPDEVRVAHWSVGPTTRATQAQTSERGEKDA